MSAGPLVDVRDLSVAYRHDDGWLRVTHPLTVVSFFMFSGDVHHWTS